MNSYKLLLIACILGILATNCEQSDPEPEFAPVNEFTTPDSDPLLFNLLANLPGNNASTRISDQLLNETIGRILTERTIKRMDDPDQYGPFYSMPVVNDPTDQVREWLVLEATADGYVGYLMQYESVHTFDLLHFTGTARILDLERNIQSEEYFEDGVQVYSENGNGRAETDYTNCDCEWVIKETDVIGPVTQEPFDADTEVWLHCICDQPDSFDADPGSSGGGTISDPGIGTPIGGGGGAGGGSGGGSGGTIGLPTECGDSGGFSTSDGTCVSEADLWEQDICIKSAFSDNDCLSDIWNTMNQLNVGYETLTNFLGENPTAELCLDVKALSPSTNGNTTPSGSTSNALITININSQNMNRSKLSIARTLLHEMIHAELIRKVIQAGWYDNFETYAQNYNDEFLAIWDYIEEYNTDGWQHEYMADQYIQYIADGLRKLEPFFISGSFKNAANNGYFSPTMGENWNWNDFYTYLAWEGLHNTGQFQSDIVSMGKKEKYDLYRDIFENNNSVDLDCP